MSAAAVASAAAAPPLAPGSIALFVSSIEEDLLGQLPWAAPSGTRYPHTPCMLHVGDVIVVRTPPPPPPSPEADDDAAPPVNAHVASAFGGGGEAGARCTPLLLVERKTVMDLANSIRERDANGVARPQRWHDQKARAALYCAQTGCRPVLLVEGYFKHAATASPVGAMKEDDFCTALLKTVCRDGWFVLHSTNFFDSARLLQKIAHFCATDGVSPERWHRLDALNVGPDGAMINVRKAANRTPADWYRNSLNAVPRFSRDAATEVLKLYPSMGALAAALADHEGAVRHALANAPLTRGARTKTGKFRKLGMRARASARARGNRWLL